MVAVSRPWNSAQTEAPTLSADHDGHDLPHVAEVHPVVRLVAVEDEVDRLAEQPGPEHRQGHAGDREGQRQGS